MSLIQNERVKLLANALDRASTSCLTVGVNTPVAGYLYGIARYAGGAVFLLKACVGRAPPMTCFGYFDFLGPPVILFALG